LQAFTLGRRLPRYTPFEIREQIRAAEDLGNHVMGAVESAQRVSAWLAAPEAQLDVPETQTVSSVRGGR